MKFPDEIDVEDLNVAAREWLLAGFELEKNEWLSDEYNTPRGSTLLWVQKPCEDPRECKVYMAYVLRGERYVRNRGWVSAHGLKQIEPRHVKNLWVP